MLASIDWQGIFVPDLPLIEIFIRGTVTYLSIFILLRVLLRRESGGNVAMTDVLVIVLLADAAQNAMAGGYNSVTDGVFLVAVIISWSLFLQFLSYKFPFFKKLLTFSKLLLVKDGKVLKKNMRRELVTLDELMTEIRKEGYQSLEEVRCVNMEGDGSISVVSKEES